MNYLDANFIAALHFHCHGPDRNGLDTMHVALAQSSGCTWFLSFDTNSNARVLAASARLKVFPDLHPAERARLVR